MINILRNIYVYISKEWSENERLQNLVHFFLLFFSSIMSFLITAKLIGEIIRWGMLFSVEVQSGKHEDLTNELTKNNSLFTAMGLMVLLTIFSVFVTTNLCYKLIKKLP